MDKTGETGRDGKWFYILCAILAIGLFVRLFDITRQSIWLDEGFSISAARDIFKLLQSSSPADFTNNYVDKNPPFYFIILHFWMKLFGYSEFALRLPSVAFGFLSIIMVFKLGDLLFNKEAGLFASFFVSLTFFQVYYSQEVRYYSLYCLLALCSFYFLVKLEKKWSLANASAYVIFTGMLLYTHVHSVFIVLAQNVYYLLIYFLMSKSEKKTDLKKWIFLQFTLLLIYIPWIRILLIQISDVQKNTWLPSPTHYQFITTLYDFTGSFIILIIFILLAPLSILKFTEKKMEEGEEKENVSNSSSGFSFAVNIVKTREFLLLLLWFLITVFVPYLYSRIKMPIFLHRYLIASSFPLYLLVAGGFSHLKSRYLKYAIVVIIVIISSFNLFGQSDPVKEFAHERWRDAAAFMDSKAKKNDLVIVNPGYCLEYVFDYYSRRKDLIKMPFPLRSASPKASGERIIVEKGDMNELRQMVNGHRRIWLIFSNNVFVGKTSFLNISEELNKTHKLTLTVPFESVDPEVYPGKMVILIFLYEAKDNNKETGDLTE